MNPCSHTGTSPAATTLSSLEAPLLIEPVRLPLPQLFQATLPELIEQISPTNDPSVTEIAITLARHRLFERPDHAPAGAVSALAEAALAVVALDPTQCGGIESRMFWVRRVALDLLRFIGGVSSVCSQLSEDVSRNLFQNLAMLGVAPGESAESRLTSELAAGSFSPSLRRPHQGI